ncbi:MAG TPA: hypothetical protein VF042_05030, partial [Gemmatimonadaceae bacterium]
MGRTFSLGFWAQIVIAPVLLAACSSPTEGSKAGPPAAIAFTTGTNQSALAGNPVAVPVVARVTDASGRGVPDVGVTFAVAAGDGGLASSVAVVTDQDGNATAPQWTLGKSAVPQTLRASIAEGLTATTSAVIQSNYTVDLRFFGPEMMPTTSAMFTAAAARIQAAVIGDLPDVLQSTPVDLSADSTCGVAGLPTAFSGTIDDVIIYASVGPIDGSGSSGGNILAFSFPCFIRGPLPARQTAIGVMKFDEADLSAMIAQGNLTDVIQHEMLHVVGLGTLWNELSLIQGAGTPQSRYSGT